MHAQRTTRPRAVATGQPPPQPQPSALYLLKRAYLAGRGLADQALTRHGISIAQYAVLRRLEDQPGLSGAELARQCFVSAPTINGLLAPLEQAGLIRRRRDPQGGRRVLAFLTDEGQALVARCHRTVDWLEDRLLAELGPPARAQLLRALRHVAESAESLREPIELVPPA